MSRSNSPMNRGGSQPRDWQRPAQPDAPGHPADASAPQPYQWPALTPQQDPAYGYGQGAASHHNGQQPQQAQYPQGDQQHPGYHYPQQDAQAHQQHPNAHQQPHGAGQEQHPSFFGAPAQGGQPAQAPIPFASQFERYLNSHQQPGGRPAPQHGGYDEQAGEPPTGRPGYGRQSAPPQDDGLAQLQQLTQQRQQHNGARDQLRGTQHDQWQETHDPRNYDLGSYMPSATSGGAGGPGGYGGAGQDPYDQQWQAAAGYGAHPAEGQLGHDPYYGQQGQHGQHGEALPVAGQQDDHEHDDDYEYEEPRRGRRGLVIVGALVGAILVGGGMAYGYKMVIGTGSKSAPPVIRADQRPVKIQPAEPGGKQFAHSDSKLMGRLEADGSGGAVAAASKALAETADEGENGVRKVSTVIIGRDGSISAPAEPRLPPSSISVPGMTIVDGFGGRPQPSLPPPRPIEPIRTAPQSIPAPSTAAATPTPQIVARAAPTPAEPEPPAVRRQAPPQVIAAVPPTPAPTPRASVVAVQPAPAASAPRASNSSGFVAVLSSQRSRMDALKTFADLQQKYTSVLQNKIPDVQEADLSARGLGTMYRVVVGPPSSREAAADVCGQLRSAGFQGCWVTAY